MSVARVRRDPSVTLEQLDAFRTKVRAQGHAKSLETHPDKGNVLALGGLTVQEVLRVRDALLSEIDESRAFLEKLAK